MRAEVRDISINPFDVPPLDFRAGARTIRCIGRIRPGDYELPAGLCFFH
jgi:hypothetical protein